MKRPPVILVLLLCGAAFLGALAVAHAKNDDGAKDAAAPAAAEAVKPANVRGLRAGASLPGLKHKRKAAVAAPAAPVASPAPLVRRSAPARSAPAPAATPAPAPTPTPKATPAPDKGTPFNSSG